jgi:hypothetical protein
MSEPDKGAVFYRIQTGVYKAMEKLGACPELLSIVGSWGDTLPDETVARMIEEWNGGTPTIREHKCEHRGLKAVR